MSAGRLGIQHSEGWKETGKLCVEPWAASPWLSLLCPGTVPITEQDTGGCGESQSQNRTLEGVGSTQVSMTLLLKTPICYMFLSDGRQPAQVATGVTQYTFHSSEQSSGRAESRGQSGTRAGMGWRDWRREGPELAWGGGAGAERD